MTRSDHAALLDRAEAAVAHAQGFLAACHRRPLGGCLEPKHKNASIKAAFHRGHAEGSRTMAD